MNQLHLTAPLLWLFAVVPVAAQDRFSDCEGAIILCDKSDLIVKKLYGVGQELSEVGFTSCSERLDERNTVWIKWQIGTPGLIEFTITPLEPGDDIDFLVYRLDDNIRTCSKKSEIRCMASGQDIGAPVEESFPCSGKMGLAKNVGDIRESDGCGDSHDNYLAAIEAKPGENYILYVNNYTSSNGFKLEWGGDAGFRTPEEIELPGVDQLQMSKAIYFRQEDNKNYEFRTTWLESAIDKAFVGKMSQNRAPNVFAGCTPIENIEKTDQQQGCKFGSLFPNPASERTNITIDAPQSMVTCIDVYDILGRYCFTQEHIVDPGEQTLQIPAGRLSAGFYFVQIRAGKTAVTKKLIVSHN